MSYSVQRRFTVLQPVVQIRLSVVAATIGAFFFAVAAAVIFHYTEPRDQHGERLVLPSSQFDWTVQAAREHFRGHGDHAATPSPVAFAIKHIGLAFLPISTDDGHLAAYIDSSTDKFSNVFSPSG
jgi:hypothetical protein